MPHDFVGSFARTSMDSSCFIFLFSTGILRIHCNPPHGTTSAQSFHALRHHLAHLNAVVYFTDPQPCVVCGTRCQSWHCNGTFVSSRKNDALHVVPLRLLTIHVSNILQGDRTAQRSLASTCSLEDQVLPAKSPELCSGGENPSRVADCALRLQLRRTLLHIRLGHPVASLHARL